MSFGQDAPDLHSRLKSLEEETRFLREQLKQQNETEGTTPDDSHFNNIFADAPAGDSSGLEMNIPTPESAAFQNSQEHVQEQAQNLVEQYSNVPHQEVIHDAYAMEQEAVAEITLNLSPEEHDTQVEQLYSLMLEKGIKNMLRVVEGMNNPHLTDDVHRFLVQYLIAGGEIPKFQKTNKNELFKMLDVSLYEVSLPKPEDGDSRTFKDFIAMMGQFYAGMQSVATGDNPDKNFYTLEVALPADTNQVAFYAAIPNSKRDLFEKQVLGLYPLARLNLVADDYNIFSDGVMPVGAYATLEHDSVLPIKTYEEFDADPLNVLLNVFSKLELHEGAAIQFSIMPVGNQLIQDFGKKLDEVKKGKKLKDIGKQASVLQITKELFWDKEEDKKDDPVEQHHIELITKKVSSMILQSHIRVVAAGHTEERSRDIVRDIASGFNQFSLARSNSLVFHEVLPKERSAFFKDFSFRALSHAKLLPFNLKELATIFHFPAASKDADQLKQAKAATAPAPMDIPKEGLEIGDNIHRGITTRIRVTPKDRMRHFYVIGQTGTGKSGTLLSMIQQDINNGDGVCFIDPHGSDVQTILSWIPPHRVDDVIYFDPAYTARPMGLNMLEYDYSRPEQKSLVIDELMGIFNQLFDMKAQGGAMFQQYFKNSAFLTMDHPESGNTLMEITRVLADKEFRDMKISHCTNPIVKQFWASAEKTTGDQGLQNFVPYISSKFDPLVSNEILRPVIAQEKSAFNVREVMDNKKILLVNLSKGRLGEINANLIGLILVGKIQMAALGRADSHGEDFAPFYLYIDEFQNVTTPSIASILSEARKYKLSLNVAHQYLSQLSDDIKNAVLGNVGSMQIFRISPEDAKALEPRVNPPFTAADIMKLDNRNAYMSLLMNGQPSTPFNMKTLDWPPQNKDIVDELKQLSYMKYGRPRDEVEAEIMAKYERNNN